MFLLRYVFLVRAENSHGLSAPSLLSEPIRTAKPQLNKNSFSNGGRMHRLAELEDARNRMTTLQVNLREARPLSPTSIRLQWDLHSSQPLHSSQIEGYYIRYRQVEPDESSTSSVVDGSFDPSSSSHTSFMSVSGSTPISSEQQYHMLTVLGAQTPMNTYLVQQLREYTLYEFFLVPFFRSVDGAPSNCRHARTFADFPSAAPQRLHVRLLNLTAVHVSWQPLPVSHRNGLIQAYQLHLTQLSTLTSSNRELPSLPSGSITASSPIQSAYPMIAGTPPVMHPAQPLDSVPPQWPLMAGPKTPVNGLDAQMLRLQHHSMQHSQPYSHLPPGPALPSLLEPNPSFHNPPHLADSSLWPSTPSLANNVRNITTNASITHTMITGLQPGALYQLRIAAGNLVGYGPQSETVMFRMDAQHLQQSSEQSSAADNDEDSIISRFRFHGQLPLLNQPSWVILLLLFAFCATCGFSSTLAMHLLRKQRAAGAKGKKFGTFGGKLASELFVAGGGMPAVGALTAGDGRLGEPIWMDRGWGNVRGTLEVGNTADECKTILQCGPEMYGGSRHAVPGEYTALEPQNDYAEVDELVNYRAKPNHYESGQCDTLEAGSSSLLLPGPYATTTLINLNGPPSRVSVRDKNSVSPFFLDVFT